MEASDKKAFGLEDTVEMMNSADYKDRFRAEYKLSTYMPQKHNM